MKKKLSFLFFMILLLNASNANAQWDKIYKSDSLVFQSVKFFNADTGIVSANNQLHTSWVFKTTNGGLNWDSTKISNYNLGKMCFVSNDTGYIVANDTSSVERISLFKTTDQGNNWFLVNDSIGIPSWANSSLVSIGFKNSSIGFISAEDKIWKTVDGGISFNQLSGYPMSWSLDMAFTNDTAYICGDWYLGFTGNLGLTFDTSLIYNPASFIHVNPVNDNVYLSGVGNDGAFLFYPTSTYAKLAVYNKISQTSNWIDFVTHEYINCSEVTPNNIYLGAVKLFSPYKPIFKSIDGGQTYYTQSSSEPGGWSASSATQIECINDTLCYSIVDRKIYKTINGGGPLIELMGVSNTEEKSKLFSVFPNPSNGVFNLKLSGDIQKGQILVTNTLGRNVLSRNIFSSTNAQIDLTNQPKGLYFITLLNEKIVYSLKIVLE